MIILLLLLFSYFPLFTFYFIYFIHSFFLYMYPPFSDLAPREIKAIGTPAEHREVQTEASADSSTITASVRSERIVGQFSRC